MLTTTCTGTSCTPAEIFISTLTTLMATQCPLSKTDLFPKDYSESLQEGNVFDFILIGAGSAGCVLANRLSEVKKWRVLLLEAGDYPSGMSEIPAIFINNLNTAEDWSFKTEPGNYCMGMINGECSWPQGKTLGGSSVINTMMYVEGNKRDYDDWAKNGAGPEWAWDEMTKYYRKLNVYQNPDSGYMYSSLLPFLAPPRESLFKAAKELGMEINPGPGTYNKYYDINATIYKGERFSASKAYLIPIKTRPNIFISVKSQVSKILITEGVAKGVEVIIQGKPIQIYARKEVIVSAGAINSPKLLMLSGIGPKEDLTKLGIPVLKDLPVGKNLQDHMMTLGTVLKMPYSLPSDSEALTKYCNNREGPLATLGMTTATGFINTKLDSEYPNIKINHVYFPKNEPLFEVVHNVTGINDETFRDIRNANSESDTLFMLLSLLKPKSRGWVKLRSKDYQDPPRINPGYISDKNGEDMKIMIEGVQWIQKLLKTSTMADIKLLNLQIPNCKEFNFETEDYWRCNIRNLGSTLYDQTGTCKMGTDSSSVVTPELKVKGLKNLRVIDSSVMPTIVSSNLNIPTIALAEKGADIVKSQWKLI